jgi:hypothetical protein
MVWRMMAYGNKKIFCIISSDICVLYILIQRRKVIYYALTWKSSEDT